MLANCSEINSSNFAFLGNYTYFFACGELQAGFLFQTDPYQTSETKIITMSPSTGQCHYSLTPNPNIINPHIA
jgi:hypothetical protein